MVADGDLCTVFFHKRSESASTGLVCDTRLGFPGRPTYLPRLATGPDLFRKRQGVSGRSQTEWHDSHLPGNYLSSWAMYRVLQINASRGRNAFDTRSTQFQEKAA